MKHVTGFVNSAGRRITTVALSRVQSRTSEVTAVEQINMIAISIRKISRALKVGSRVGQASAGPYRKSKKQAGVTSKQRVLH
jgi:hypothetical protein